MHFAGVNWYAIVDRHDGEAVAIGAVWYRVIRQAMDGVQPARQRACRRESCPMPSRSGRTS